MTYTFDFDVAWDAFENASGDVLPAEADIRRVARAHGVAIDRVVYVGPGGGNPNIFATAPDRDAARRFLAEVYGYASEDDIQAYVEPALP